MLKTIQDKARHRTRPLWAWLKLLWQRIDEDNMTTLAGNLAYVSLLSLVPLVAVVFALSPLFPCFPTSAFSYVTLFLPTFCLLLAMLFSGISNNLLPIPTR
ncbi:hypothetical protein O5511_12855 [Escherichia coli]|nr:hypothetical protein [Escherichia coli]